MAFIRWKDAFISTCTYTQLGNLAGFRDEVASGNTEEASQ